MTIEKKQRKVDMTMKENFRYDVDAIRAQFPACKLEIADAPIAYLDGPGGTQVPQAVLDAIVGYLVNDNANEDGNFRASTMARYTEETARAAAADFLGCEVQEVGFSMASTQNSFNLALNISKNLKPGERAHRHRDRPPLQQRPLALPGAHRMRGQDGPPGLRDPAAGFRGLQGQALR